MANNYELMSIFRVTGEEYLKGIEAVKTILKKNGAQIKSDVDFEDRALAYPIQKEGRGHYHLFNFSADPSILVPLDEHLKLTKEMLRWLVVRKK